LANASAALHSSAYCIQSKASLTHKSRCFKGIALSAALPPLLIAAAYQSLKYNGVVAPVHHAPAFLANPRSPCTKGGVRFPAAVRHLRCWCRHWHRTQAIALLTQGPRLCEACHADASHVEVMPSCSIFNPHTEAIKNAALPALPPPPACRSGAAVGVSYSRKFF
jgi:hypothetical protein